MRTFTQTELNEILRKHKLWLKGEPEGERANLCWANLSGADLSGADLWRANLSGADLHRADLHRANLSGANLSFTDLSLTNLSGAYLIGINLIGADLRGAYLFGANLSAADLSGANLSGANLSETIIDCPLVCPETGSFIGYKKVRGNRIVKLEIPEDAMRSSATTRKCRCSKAKVISITTLNGETSKLKVAHSKHDPHFTYTVGETVEVSDFDINRWSECAPGIHFFMTREEAVAY